MVRQIILHAMLCSISLYLTNIGICTDMIFDIEYSTEFLSEVLALHLYYYCCIAIKYYIIIIFLPAALEYR